MRRVCEKRIPLSTCSIEPIHFDFDGYDTSLIWDDLDLSDPSTAAVRMYDAPLSALFRAFPVTKLLALLTNIVIKASPLPASEYSLGNANHL